MVRLFGGVEAGGTKFVCMIGRNPDDIVKEERFSTTNPTETIKKVVDFFMPYKNSGELTALGIATFGPVDLNTNSDTYGYITSTPKPGWENIDLRGEIQRGLDVPTAFDTDVNAAAYGEQYWVPKNQSLDPFIYVTIGTGIGVGVIANGSLLHGLIHPEGGHMAIPHDWQQDPFPGVCPYHGDCWEGLASGVAIRDRWQKKPEEIPDFHPAWELEAKYIASALVTLIYTYSPMRIILGGGVIQHPGLHQAVCQKVLQVNNGYVQSKYMLENINDYICLPVLGNRSGVLGAIAMAIQSAV